VDDVRALALPALRHRLVLSYRADVDGVKADDIVEKLLSRARG
jgi:MoxR-like ATPase